MKILELRFKNLNSLYGEWVIDFTAPDFDANGIFALTGPTGAGKSTILDAVCLALYGMTPRLGKVTKSGNDIMSRQTGECYAEVTFESRDGRFRCNWYQHRARKSPDGKLSDARHEISNALTGEVLESRRKEVAELIEEKTGMDFERFTRSILLAQGGFDTFLRANAEQKSKILEQITGTEIYTEISRRVHERLREEQDKLNLLKAETSGITVMTALEEEALRNTMDQARTMESGLKAKYHEVEEAISWIRGIHALKQEITTLSGEEVLLNEAMDEFSPRRAVLEHAVKASELDGEYATLISLRQQQESELKTVHEEAARIPELEKSAMSREKAYNAAETRLSQVKEEQQTRWPVIQKVRMLDQQILDRKKSLDDFSQELSQLSASIETNRQCHEKFQGLLQSSQKLEDELHRYQESCSKDAELVTQFAGIEEQLMQLKSLQKDLSSKEASFQKIQQRLETAARTLEQDTCTSDRMRASLKAIQHTQQNLRNDLYTILEGRTLGDYRTEKEQLLREMGYLRKIADLEKERELLMDGIACPLCGALQHPFASGNVPAVDETDKKISALTELIRKVELCETDIKNLEEQEKKCAADAADSDKREAESRNEWKNVGQSSKEAKEELTTLRERMELQIASLTLRLNPYSVKMVLGQPIKTILNELESRLRKWLEMRDRKDEVLKKKAEYEGESRRISSVIETLEKSRAEKNRKLEAGQKEIDALKADRTHVFGDRDPEAEEKTLGQAFSDADKAVQSARNNQEEAMKMLHSSKVLFETMNEKIRLRAIELGTLEDLFVVRLKNAGFEDEGSFLQSRLPLHERNAISTQAREFDDRATQLQARKRDRELRLAETLDRKVTSLTLDELEQSHKELEGMLKKQSEEIAGFIHRLMTNQEAKNKYLERMNLIEARQQECLRWEKLHGLIGSADGKKYRNFAQGLTFEIMVSHANRQLEKMTDRYLLTRQEDLPLELDVLDNYQGGEIRSTRNLSGGESFIVSLSLALGLSKMASRKVRVDSLFLDEGFGMLDEESLETALNTLSGLHQDGKLIGIISHVSALKDRISTQINVQQISGGKSRIIGPGCREI